MSENITEIEDTQFDEWVANSVKIDGKNRYVAILELPHFEEKVKIRLVLEPGKRIEFSRTQKEAVKLLAGLFGVEHENMTLEQKGVMMEANEKMNELSKDIAKALMSDGGTPLGEVQLENTDLEWITPANFEYIIEYVNKVIDPLGLKAQTSRQSRTS